MTAPSVMSRLLGVSLPRGLSLALDVALVVVFVLIGRRSHEDGYAIPGLLLAIAPFLVGLLAGWGLIRWRSGAWPRRVGHGATLAVSTVVLGLLGRVATGQGVGEGVGGVVTFAAVALAFLLLFLVGWRLAAASVLARRPSR